ncbi:Cell division protein [Saliniradius amylolyticus]|uniref:Cell division protein n=1 Tax=Saliniradius amylolyticus TaxID=2183582 RepID=A0A2S2E6C4_9ALTE|nr:AAA family ATPase [Saliniradius amylolyticus]AWL13198.1 Cell division protein [Saliniradius amylolyticus]
MRKAFGDLHKRLIHLTNYVSGMVIIGGNQAAAQSRFMRDFISEQSDAVNLAYLHGKTQTTEAQYRQQLLTQLLGRAEDDHSSLTHQLGSLLGQQQQVLIAISGADHLSNKLVKELWHLARNAESIEDGHLAIILAGEQEWADAVRHHLDGSHLPVFVPYDFSEGSEAEAPEPSQLDRLIADKRRAFSERLRQRQDQTQNTKSTKSNKPILMMVAALVFMGCFGGLLLWLYPELLTNVGEVPEESRVRVQSDAEPSLPADTIEKEPEQAGSDEPPLVAEPESDKVVTDWQTAVKEITPVEDVEQPQQEESTEPEPPADRQQNEPSPADTSSQTQPAVAELPQYAWNEAQILTLPKSHYVLQLSAASQSEVLSDFRQRHDLSDALRYRTNRYGGHWHVLVSSDSYASLDEARQALAALPQPLQQEGAFAKRVAQVHKEIQQGYAEQTDE